VETVEVDRAREEKKTMLVSKVDWSLFKDAASKGRGGIQGEDTAEGSASALQELAMQACNVSIPWRRVKRGHVSWNANLQRMRAETRKARINMQKERDQERRVELREVFRRKRAAYKEAIREAKIQSLRRTLSRGSRRIDGALLTDSSPARRGDKRHRGRPSRTARGTGPETAMALIRKYFPEDDLGTDRPENRETRASRVERSDDQARDISFQELRRTIQ
jgi:hypothetical protein